MLNLPYLASLPPQLIFSIAQQQDAFKSKYPEEILPCMDFIVDTALDNIGRPLYIDGSVMSWLDDGLEGAIREYMGIADDCLLPPHAQSLFDVVMEDVIALCYELCVFFTNLKIPMVDNVSVYTVESVINGNVVLRIMSNENLEDYLHTNHEDPPF